MREYKFRGKRFEDGEWIYGSYTHCHDGDGNTTIIPFGGNYHVSVFTDSVGQYTGLKDKNGIEIYKGDVWLYHGVGYHVCWHEDEAKFYFKHPSLHAGDDDHIDLGWSSHGEIIGDIIDNPELLEG